MMNSTAIKTPLRMLALVSTVAILAAFCMQNNAYATTPPLPESSQQALDYVGTQVCLSCHKDKATFIETGHNFKLTKVIDGQVQKRPFTNFEGSLEMLVGVENAAGQPNSWEDVSYVIGGYRRCVMFVDKEGFVVTGKSTIINLPEKDQPFTIDLGWALPWYEGAGPDAQPFDYCGRCHTTGWKDYTSEEGDFRNRNRQDNLRGMGGTFNQTGIQCEACHGAGSAYAKAATENNITKVASGRTSVDLRAEDMGYGKAVACGECHSKGGERLYPTYTSKYNKEFGGDSLGGRTKNYPEGARLATDAILGIDPDTGVPHGKKKDFKCTTCHNPHMSTTNRDKPGHENALIKKCTDCHYKKFADAAGGGDAAAAHLEAECTDCHMPSQYHLFQINLSSASDNPEHFSKDGKYMQPWLTAKMSCKGCHDDFDEKTARIKKVHL
jgi:hypothetical protein